MKIYEEVRDAATIGISGHIRPDGDCIGSVMGLYLYLLKKCPDAQIEVFLEQPGEEFSCISRIGDIHTDFAAGVEQFDVFIVLDSTKERTGEAQKYFDAAHKRINIDHHVSNLGDGDVNFLDPKASSASELVYRAIDDKEVMDPSIAKALYIGIIHDTGVFKHSNTTKETMEIAGKLIAFGIPFGKIIDDSFYRKTYKQLQIMGRCLMESVRIMDGRCLFSIVRQNVMKLYEAKPSDLDGIIDEMRTTEGVEVAILLDEREPGEFKVSMRSNEIVDVSVIARYFGGGGHVRAAGCAIKGSAFDVINNLTGHIEKQLG